MRSTFQLLQNLMRPGTRYAVLCAALEAEWACSRVGVAGTEVAKNAADIVLLAKDLRILGMGITTGRMVYGNTIK